MNADPCWWRAWEKCASADGVGGVGMGQPASPRPMGEPPGERVDPVDER